VSKISLSERVSVRMEVEILSRLTSKDGYVYNPQEDWSCVSPGWGGNTDLYKNLLHNPHVMVQVGRRKFEAVAKPAPDEEAAEFMMNVSRSHPSMAKVWNRWSDKPVDGTRESYVYAAKFFPSVRLRPKSFDQDSQ
jgi:hypothetical protein